MNIISFSTYGRRLKNNDWAIRNGARNVNRLYYIHSGSAFFGSETDKHAMLPGRLYLVSQNFSFMLKRDHLDFTFFKFLTVPAIMMDDILEIQLTEYPLIQSATKILFDLAATYPMEQSPTDPEIYALTTSYLNNLLLLIMKEFNIDTVQDPIVNDAAAYFHHHLKEPIIISELADRYHLEKNVFIRKFKKAAGTTPYQYLKNLRLHTALSLINYSHYTLSQAAEQVGYGDAAALSHALKKECIEKSL